MVTGEMFLNRVYLFSVMNKPYMMKPDVNAMPPAAKNWLILATSGVYGPRGRVDAALLAAKNPDYAGLLPQVADVPAPEDSAERQGNETTAPHHSKNLVDRLLGKSTAATEKIGSSGDKYSEGKYAEAKYENSAYADQSRQPTAIVYLSRDSFRKAADASKKIRAVYQHKENDETGPAQNEYDPLRNSLSQARILQFPTGETIAKYSPPIRQSGTIDDLTA